MPLWLQRLPLLLASESATRRAIIEAAGIPVETEPAGIDEREIEAASQMATAGEVAVVLAGAKAQAVGAKRPARIVVGADQTLSLGERRMSKPTSRAAAREQLQALRGRTHTLHSAAAVAVNGKIVFSHLSTAPLTMRSFTDAFLDCYLDEAGDAVTRSVGAYQLEGLGIQLFERIEGDHFTILGLPLLPLVGYLRSSGFLVS